MEKHITRGEVFTPFDISNADPLGSVSLEYPLLGVDTINSYDSFGIVRV